MTKKSKPLADDNRLALWGLVITIVTITTSTIWFAASEWEKLNERISRVEQRQDWIMKRTVQKPHN